MHATLLARMSRASTYRKLGGSDLVAAGKLPAAYRPLAPKWIFAAVATVLFSTLLTLLSSRFGYDAEVIDMPCLFLTGILISAGVVFVAAIPRLIAQTESARPGETMRLMAIIVAGGLVARLVLFASEPILEDDYNRYLWDGAVTVSGNNPYARSPLSAMESGPHGTLGAVAAEAGDVLPRINHKSLTTIYPPIAQGAFALAHLIEPWSLTAWRSVLLIFDLGTLALLVALLNLTGRSPLWSALYWLNPVVLKEIFNSAHMEAIILPFVLLALLLASRRRPLLATAALSLAAGAKFWPALLLPLVVRQLWGERVRLAAALLIFLGLMALWLTPMLINGFNESAGLAAYVDRWQTNSALFPTIVSVLSSLQDWIGLRIVDAGGLARALIAAILTTTAIAIARPQLGRSDDLIARASLIVAALVLLSPAQLPWYTIWMA
ncbi:MAG: glycosyltransferase 87 family protein, partial [Thermomicrobiales bacterium]